jgi:UDP-3-O-[3-hydroxymyristoyl] glucosamine N-acyltransferase
MAATLAELARQVRGRVRGNPDVLIERVAPLETAGPRDIAYVAGGKYLELLSRTAAGAVILGPPHADRYTGTALIVDDPHLGFVRIAALLNPPPAVRPGIHPAAVVDPAARVAATAWVGPGAVVEAGAVVGEQAFIGPGCLLGKNTAVGARTRLVARVVVNDGCALGAGCLVQPGAVIGGDGFGFAKDGSAWIKQPQLGRVVVGDDVEIGANTTIDRGAMNDTFIGNGVKLDNLIQIAHNVRIGEHTAIAACVGIAGSVVVGKRCTIGGQAGITGHLEIADDVHITAGSLVTSSIAAPGAYSSSLKAEPVERWRKNAARLHHLDELARRLKRLEEKHPPHSEE